MMKPTRRDSLWKKIFKMEALLAKIEDNNQTLGLNAKIVEASTVKHSEQYRTNGNNLRREKLR